MKKSIQRFLLILCLFLLFVVPCASDVAPTAAGLTDERVARFGIGFSGKYAYDLIDYDLEQLKVGDIFPFGWYSDWSTNHRPEPPQGMEYAQLVKVGSKYYPPDWNDLQYVVERNPGAMWFIGNEPECIYQGNRTPSEYAEIYHEMYTFLKSHDPMAQVAVGGVVQPSPLRLQWLDQVLIEYQQAYTDTMPMDAWTIHNQILNEEQGSWGADIPAGIQDTENQALQLSLDQNASMELFTKHVEDFRAWMKANGFQDKPLIISEYGVLLPSDFFEDGDETVTQFMLDTFDYLLTAIDPETGNPNDGYRLVQRWLWYSLNEEPYNNDTGQGFNGSLFQYDQPDQLTAFGEAFVDWAWELYGQAIYLPIAGRNFG